VITAIKDLTVTAWAAVTAGGRRSCSARSAAAAAIAVTLSGMFRRRARLSTALTCARVSFAARAGSGALPSSSRVPAASRSPKASSAAGKCSSSWCRSRCTCPVRSQISVLCVRASTSKPSAAALSPATARS